MNSISIASLLAKLESIRQRTPSNDKTKEKDLNDLNNEIESMAENSSPEITFVKAGIQEQLASLKRSNPLLERAIHFYREIVYSAENVESDDLYLKSAEKCIELMKFRGWTGQSVKIYQFLINRFPLNGLVNAKFRQQLGVAHLTIGQNDKAKEVFEDQIKINQDAFSKAHLGFILKTEGVNKDDTALLQRAVELIDFALRDETESKSLEGLFYFHLGDAYRRLGQAEKADEIFQLATDRQIFQSFWQRSLYNEPNLKAQPVWPLKETGILSKFNQIKAKFDTIQKEALSVYDSKAGGFVKETEGLKDTGYWGQFDLFVQGRKNAQNCAKAPITCALIESIPEVKNNRRGQVKFSVMKAGTHVHPHSGPTNCRLRAHMGLKIPQRSNATSTALRVADQLLHWSEGDIFVFDDSFDHEVWNLDGDRIVFIFDLWHPQLSAEKRASLPAI